MRLSALQTVQSRIEQGQLVALEAIGALLGEEYSTRKSRRVKIALQTARLMVLKTLAELVDSMRNTNSKA